MIPHSSVLMWKLNISSLFTLNQAHLLCFISVNEAVQFFPAYLKRELAFRAYTSLLSLIQQHVESCFALLANTLLFLMFTLSCLFSQSNAMVILDSHHRMLVFNVKSVLHCDAVFVWFSSGSAV